MGGALGADEKEEGIDEYERVVTEWSRGRKVWRREGSREYRDNHVGRPMGTG